MSRVRQRTVKVELLVDGAASALLGRCYWEQRAHPLPSSFPYTCVALNADQEGNRREEALINTLGEYGVRTFQNGSRARRNVVRRDAARLVLAND